MKKTLVSVVLLLAISFFLKAEEEKGPQSKKQYIFTSGFSGGTYYQIAKSLKNISSVELKVIASKGSVENINRLKLGEAHIGLAQVDILTNSYLYDREIKSKVKILSPVYQEEVHILVKRSLKKIKQLHGKKISIGPVGSGTNKTSRILLGTLGLTAGEKGYEELTTTDALQALLAGKIDAFTLVAGAPVQLLQRISKKNRKKIRLLGLKGPAYRTLTGKHFSYDKVKLKKRTYKWHRKTIKTIAARSLIIVRSDLSDEYVKELFLKIFKKKKKLTRSHKKWKQLSKKYTRKLFEENEHFFHPAIKSQL